jgi:hypothetical protein
VRAESELVVKSGKLPIALVRSAEQDVPLPFESLGLAPAESIQSNIAVAS